MPLPAQTTSCARVRFLILIAAILTITNWCGQTAFSQDRTTSAIAGIVEDENDAPIPGATVQIRSSALIGGARSLTTDAQGRFRFAELPPGVYDISVTLPGFQAAHKEGIQLSVGMTAEIPIEMFLSAGEQSITVEGSSKLIDPTTSSMTTILSPEYIQNIPSDRDTSHIMDLAPGINIESAYGAAEESGTSYEMDGVDISDPQAGAPWSFLNYSIIDQVELVGLGAPAEYGQFTGVVFNTITKSGTNDFSGDVETYYTGGGLTASSPDPSLAAEIDREAEVNAQLGGPIRKDKLWYFLAAQYLDNRQSEGGPIETEKDPRVFFKLTYAPHKNSTLDGWIEWDHTKITGRDADAFTPLEATTGEDNPEIVGNLSWKSILSQNSVLSIAWGGYTGHHHFNPQNGFDLPGHVNAETGFASVNASQFGIVDRTRNQLNASIGHHVSDLIKGYHDFKFGTEIEHSKVHDRYGYPGNAFFSDNEGPEEDPSTGEDDFFTLKFLGGGYSAHGTGNRISLFAQDAWRISNRFTLNPGVRLDINRGKVSNGVTVFKTNALAPRIGFAWDLGEDGHSILRAHYGRYYEALYAAYYYYMDPGAFFPLTLERTFNTSGFIETISSNPGQQYAMAPNIKQPHLDQYIFGFDQQLPLGIVLSAVGIYRKNADLIETISRDGVFVPVIGIVPTRGQQVTLYDYLNPNTDVLIYTNPKGLNRSYRGIIISATRHMKGNWQLMASYVYSQTRGNIDNLGFDETGIGGNTPFFDGHFLDTPNSLVNAQGRLTHDQKHQIKLQGTWEVPSLHLSLSANYTYHSGDTWTPRSDCLLTDDGNGVIGDGILDCHEFPQGPVLYFAEPRGGRRLPARNEIDLRAQWQVNFANQQLALFVDVFNLTNQSRPMDVETIIDEEFGNPATLNFPRSARLGLSFSW
jgi:outer membrane receptor protein involved in Fe transport